MLIDKGEFSFFFEWCYSLEGKIIVLLKNRIVVIIRKVRIRNDLYVKEDEFICNLEEGGGRLERILWRSGFNLFFEGFIYLF